MFNNISFRYVKVEAEEDQAVKVPAQEVIY